MTVSFHLIVIRFQVVKCVDIFGIFNSRNIAAIKSLSKLVLPPIKLPWTLILSEVCDCSQNWCYNYRGEFQLMSVGCTKHGDGVTGNTKCSDAVF